MYLHASQFRLYVLTVVQSFTLGAFGLRVEINTASIQFNSASTEKHYDITPEGLDSVFLSCLCLTDFRKKMKLVAESG